ncbi:hypothetical protein [Streptomyces sp. BA2]|uniref:hypothetical protein n=1 Tax=Streptomyces sp. BA2 TaxID=436595 RepID=UPI0013254F29|nr:hypothetical protein [Streptomyces sp. BA2]MWA08703.1 hypothetical protein [Streptomyces sp. BA2]
MTKTESEIKLQGRIYDSLAAFNKTAEWPALQLAQMRQHLAEHLANDLLSSCRPDILAEAIEAARGEYLEDSTGTPEDEAYNQAVSDVVAAIGALLEGK